MSSPERVEERLVAAFFGIIVDSDNLRVSRGSGTHICVGWIMQKPLAITNLGLGHARQPLEGQLDAPKAASTKLGKLLK